MKKGALIFYLSLIGMVAGAGPAAAKSSHTDRISKFEGTQTCLMCHRKAAKDFAVSLHYQQQAEPRFLKDWPKGQMAGMMGSY